MIAITGATGNIGSRLAGELLLKNEKIRCIARGRQKLETLAGRGAETAVVDLTETDALAAAFSGADAVFAMIPPHYGAADFRAYQNKVGQSIADAVVRAGVRAVVNLSSQGAHLSDGTGPIKGLYDQEQRLNRIRQVDILHLRPTYFMENFLVNIGTIRDHNVIVGALEPDLKLPMIATKDIARLAAARLAKRDFSGKTVSDLLGQRDLSMNEAARIIGAKSGRPDLRYVPSSYEETEKALSAMGISADAARLFVEMLRAFNDGLIRSRRTTENTTETPFEDFAEVFAAILAET